MLNLSLLGWATEKIKFQKENKYNENGRRWKVQVGEKKREENFIAIVSHGSVAFLFYFIFF